MVLNPDFGDGCATSIRTALARVRDDAAGVVLLLGDQPGVTAATIRGAGRPAPRATRVGVCEYDDGLGHPLWFDRTHVRRPLTGPARRQGGLEAGRRGRGRRAGCRVPGPVPPRRRHLGGLPGPARGAHSGAARGER